MSSILAPVTTVALALTLSVAACAESNTKNLTLREAVQVNGTTLPAGSYKVKYELNGSNAQVAILQGKKQIVTASGEVKQLPKKAGANQIVVRHNGNVPELAEIDFDGQKTGIALTSGSEAAGK